MAKVFIGVGHGGSDPGAVANGIRESDLNLQISLAMLSVLERHGVETGISRTTDTDDRLGVEISKCNSFAPDLAVEIHNNAGGGKGFEVYRQTNSYSQTSLKLAQAIERQVKLVGQNSRGVKTKLDSNGKTDYFGWLREVKAPAVLCEGLFIDNKDDVSLVGTPEKQRAFGEAYAKGVLEILGIAYRDPDSGDCYVQVFYGSRAGAEAYAEKIRRLKIDGTAIPAVVKKA